jgi:hypothetical protein
MFRASLHFIPERIELQIQPSTCSKSINGQFIGSGQRDSNSRVHGLQEYRSISSVVVVLHADASAQAFGSHLGKAIVTIESALTTG